MPFASIRGQAAALETLTRAITQGRVHHAYRFEGPEGVGKELSALALAQSLLCEAPAPLACGTCSSCLRACRVTETEPHVPQHPDIVLLARGLYPGKMLGMSHNETAGISVEQVRRLVLARLPIGSHEGKGLVFIIRSCDELTEQASNALLKTLEEPSPGVHFLLLTSRPRRLLDTIRSRTLPVRFGPLPDAIIAEILEQHGKDPAIAPLAQGSATLALDLADEETATARNEFVRKAFDAVTAPDLATAIGFAERPESRDALRAELGFFAQAVARRATQELPEAPASAERWAARHRDVLLAMTELERGQPLLILEQLVSRLRRA